MIVLLVFCLPLVFAASVTYSEEKKRSIVIYGVGILLSAVTVSALSAIFQIDGNMTDSLTAYLLYHFFIDTVIPLCIVLPVCILIARFHFLTTSAALFGFFTVKVYQFLFLTSAEGRITPVVLRIVLYVGAGLCFDALLRLCSVRSWRHFTQYAILLVGFFCITAIGWFAVSLWYFKGSGIIYSTILSGLLFVGIALQCIRAKN